VVTNAIDMLGGRASSFLFWVLLLCCMASRASEVYRLTFDEVRRVCAYREFDGGGIVTTLRQTS
jgi:hypothetical protein